MARRRHTYRPRDGPQASLDRVVARLAARQHGVVCHAQHVELGMSSDGVKRWLRNERLVALHRGVYAVGHTGLTLRGRELAAVFACGPQAVRSHQSAGRLWGLVRSGSSRIDVTALRSGERRSEWTVHTTRRLAVEDRDAR